MIFILGIIIGFLIAVSSIMAGLYLRYPIQRTIQRAEQHSAFRPKGDLYIPQDESQDKRDKIVAKNNKKGRDTHLDELR